METLMGLDPVTNIRPQADRGAILVQQVPYDNPLADDAGHGCRLHMPLGCQQAQAGPISPYDQPVA